MENENKKLNSGAYVDPWATGLMREYGSENKCYMKHRDYNVAVEQVDLFYKMGIKLHVQTPEMLERVNAIMKVIDRWEEFRQDGILLGWRRQNDDGCVTAWDDKILDAYKFDLTDNEITLDEFIAAQKKVITVKLRRQKDGEPVDVEKQFYKKLYNKVKAMLCNDEIKNGMLFSINSGNDVYTNNGAILRYLAGKAIDKRQVDMPAVEMSDFDIYPTSDFDEGVITAKQFDRNLSKV